MALIAIKSHLQYFIIADAINWNSSHWFQDLKANFKRVGLRVHSHFIIWRNQYSVAGNRKIGHFTVVGLVTWPLNGSEAGVDLVSIQTSLLLLCKSSCSYAN